MRHGRIINAILRWADSRLEIPPAHIVPSEAPDLDTAYVGYARGWMQTYSGRKFMPLAPQPGDIELADVAHGLAMTCRYGGHTKRFYSVAEHCVLVSENVPIEYAREALLHDSAEAYIGDMIRPLKHQPEMLEFRKAEAAIEAAVFARFGIITTDASHKAVKEIDDRILVDETRALMQEPALYTEFLGLEPLGIHIYAWSPEQAQAAYILRYRELFT